MEWKMVGVDFHEMGLCILIRNACMICERDLESGSGDIQPSAVKEPDYAVRVLNQAYAQEREDSGGYYGLDFGEDSFQIPSSECLISVQEMLEEVFLTRGEADQLKKRIEHVITGRERLLSAVDGKHPFPPYKAVVSYLDDYYRLLKACFCIRESMKESGLLEKGFLEQVLNLDYEDGYAGLYAPPVLLGLRNLYDSLLGYRKVIRQMKSDAGYPYYREVFISKTLRLFRWYTVRGGEVYHAAIPSYCGGRHEEVRWKLQIPVRPIEEYSSYEGIGEMRLLDKVLYELERRGGSVPEELNISIMGDIGPQPMQSLCDTLDRMCFDDNTQLSKINIQVYSKNTDYIEEEERSFRSGAVSCRFYQYTGQLKSPSEVTGIIEDSDICFILDCCDIYTGFEVKPLADTEMFWQRVATDDYDRNYYRIGGARNLCRRGNLADLFNVLTAFAWKGKAGTLHKNENTSLMTYIEKECQRYNEDNSKPAKSVYIYVSDVGAFRDFYSSSNRFVRVERYREKEIAIIRFSNFTEIDLRQHNNQDRPYEKVIVFNLWQMVKHVSIRHWEELVPFGCSENCLPLLRNILVGIHYEDWPTELRFSYYIPEKHKEEVSESGLRSWLENVILPFFRRGSRDIYNAYFIKSMGSFLYSDAKSLDDMLFLHLFMNQHDVLRSTELLKANDEHLEKLKRKDGKYSQKRFYGDVMRDYDTSSERFALKYAKLDRIESESKGKLNRRIMFKNIIEACEENQYDDSYLYYNCLKML